VCPSPWCLAVSMLPEGGPATWLAGCLAVWPASCLAVWLAGCLAAWPAAWLPAWLAPVLPGWLSRGPSWRAGALPRLGAATESTRSSVTSNKGGWHYTVPGILFYVHCGDEQEAIGKKKCRPKRNVFRPSGPWPSMTVHVRSASEASYSLTLCCVCFVVLRTSSMCHMTRHL